MSQYVYLFLRKNDEFVPVGNYSRNSTMAVHFWNDSPCEKIRPVTINELDQIDASLGKKFQYFREQEAAYQKMIEQVNRMNNTIDEKCAKIAQYEDDLAEMREEKEEYEQDAAELRMLRRALEGMEYDNKWREKDEEPYEYGLYVGVDTGRRVTKDFILAGYVQTD